MFVTYAELRPKLGIPLLGLIRRRLVIISSVLSFVNVDLSASAAAAAKHQLQLRQFVTRL